jgi:hypothetical protein
VIDELPEIIEWMSIHHDSRSIPRQHGLDIAGFDPVKYSLSILVCCLMASATFAGQKFDFEQFRDRLPWIWQSPRQVEPPKVKDSVWPADTVDRFVLRKLEAEKLKPAGPANDRVWVRRVYFAITGLPPKPEDIQAFLDDTSKNRKRTLVRALLDSPHYGERWARHWMDLVRYAESRGHEGDNILPNAYRYRDYLIRAFNADLPYDALVTEHLAGDLLENPRLHPKTGANESILATGWPFFGELNHAPVNLRKDECEQLENKIDVMSKTFLGLTVACARCHDHKFDAIHQRDYYAMAGFILSSSYRQARFESMEQNKAVAEKLEGLRRDHLPKIAKAFVAAARPVVDALGDDVPVELATTPLYPVEGKYQTVADYTQGHTPWLVDGPTFGQSPALPGQLMLVTGDQPLALSRNGGAIRDAFWSRLKNIDSENDPGGLLNGLSRAGKTIRTPTVTLASGQVYYLIRGKATVYAAVSQNLFAGPLHGTLAKTVEAKGDAPRWIGHNLKRYAGQRVHFEISPVGDAPFELLQVIDGGTPKQEPREKKAVSRKELHRALDDLNDGRLEARHVPHIAWLLKLGKVKLPDAVLKAWQTALEGLVKEAQWESRLAVSWWGGTGVDEHVLGRGSPQSPGERVGRNLPELLAMAPLQNRSSGRLELARQLTAKDHPLTSRVIVNRIWHQIFGRGIVATPDNFGWLGQRPSHPDLLDYLAVEFAETHSHSIKSLIERIVLTKTFGMSSTAADPVYAEKDPDNRWLHRMPLRRLEAEAIRDSALAISGRLDRTVGGKPIPIHLTEFVVGRGGPKKSGPLDGAGRRSIYTALRRNFIPTLMLTFDFPGPFTTMGKRDITNVAGQSLALMNDRFLYGQSGIWARRIIKEQSSAPERIRQMYAEAFARPPSDGELAACLEALTAFTELYGEDPNGHEAWRDLCHSFYSMTDFIYLK